MPKLINLKSEEHKQDPRADEENKDDAILESPIIKRIRSERNLYGNQLNNANMLNLERIQRDYPVI